MKRTSSPPGPIVKALIGLMTVVLVACIVVQYNDPDGLIWIAIYGYAAFTTLLCFRQTYLFLTVLGAIAYFLGAYSQFPPDLQVPIVDSEEARESLGLLISGMWLAVLTGIELVKRRQRITAQSGAH